jgi:hypothetical protein
MIHPSHVVMSIVSAMFSLLLALGFAAAGVPLALWAAGATWRAETAREWAVWFLDRSPLPLYAAPSQVANDALQRDSLIAASLAAALLCLMAFSLLRSAQRSLRRADESHDGRATIHLTSQPLRVGRPVEGSIWLARGSQNGGVYRLELSCSRGHGPRRSEGTETAYCEELEVAPVATPVGWSLPFRFLVPSIAPPSGVSRFMSGPGYRWRLTFRRAGGWMSPSVFALDLDPAPAEELRELERRERREPEFRRPVLENPRPASRAPAHDRGNPPQPAAPAFNAANPRQPHESGRTTRATATPHERANGQQPPPSGAAKPEQPRENPRTTGATAPAHDRASAQQPAPSVLEEVRRAAEMGLLDHGAAPDIRNDPRLHERPEFQEDEDEVRGTNVVARVVKWLFLAVFGGALAVSAIALVTAVLLGYVL